MNMRKSENANKSSLRFKTENIINLDVERAERTTEDYKSSGEPRMQAALRDAIQSEVDGSVLEFVAQDNLPDLLKVPVSAKEKLKIRNSSSDGPGFLSPSRNEGRLYLFFFGSKFRMRSNSLSAPIPSPALGGLPIQSVDDNNYPVARGLVSRKLRH